MIQTTIKKWLKTYNEFSIGIKAAFWYTFCNLLQKGISFIAVPIYTRILTPEEYGNYSVFLSWIDIFEIIVTLRIAGGGYVAGLTKYSDDNKRYSDSVQGLELFLTTIWVIFYALFSEKINFLTGMDTHSMIFIIMLMYAMPAISFWNARQRVEYKYIPVIAVTLLTSILIPAIGIATSLLMDSSKEFGIIGARVFVQSILGFILIFTCITKSSSFFNKVYWIKTLKFNIPLVPYYLSTIILQSSDRIMIKNLVDTASAGIYGVANSAAMIMMLFNSSIHAAFQPWFFNKLKTKQYNNISETINFLLVLVAILNLLLIAFAPEAIFILAPASYQEAVWVIPPLASSVFVMFFYEHFINVEIFYENTNVIAGASVGAAVLNVVLNLIFIPQIGFLVAGYTTLFCYIVFCFTHYIFMKRLCKKNNCPYEIVDIKTMVIIMIVFFGVVSVVAFGYPFWLLRYAIILVLVSLIFFKRKMLMDSLKLLRNKG